MHLVADILVLTNTAVNVKYFASEVELQLRGVGVEFRGC